MSFAIWQSKPPFPEEHLNEGERIYYRAADGSWQHYDPETSKVPEGALFVVTSQGAPTQEQVDAVLKPSP